MQLVIWVVYFFTDVYGHIALKSASQSSNVVATLFSPWGLTAGIAWIVSGLSWTLILSKHSLLTANTVSALGYAFISLSAWVIFRETMTPAKLLGTGLVCIGIYLVVRS